MSFDFATSLLIPLVVVGCLCVGYCVKHILPIDNKWIPTVLFVIGATFGCLIGKEFSIEAIISGGFSGLASTGLYEAFKQLVEKPKTIDGEKQVDDQ